jgi:hypothetical protein
MHGDIDLYTMNPDGTGLKQITTRMRYDGGAWFSARWEAHRVARGVIPRLPPITADYERLLKDHLVRPSRTEVWVATPTAPIRGRSTSLGGANFAPVFTPDGKKIIFSSNYKNPRSGAFDLYLINVDGTGLEAVTTNPDFDSFPMFSTTTSTSVWASNGMAASRARRTCSSPSGWSRLSSCRHIPTRPCRPLHAASTCASRSATRRWSGTGDGGAGAPVISGGAALLTLEGEQVGEPPVSGGGCGSSCGCGH